MTNITRLPEYYWTYEYYIGYVDPHPVDARQLKANRYSIVIGFWIGLTAFVAFLFFILFYISRTGSVPIRNGRPRKRFPWNYSKKIHENHTADHGRSTLVEEIEGNGSNSRLPCNDLSNTNCFS